MPYKRLMERTIDGKKDSRLYLFPDVIYVFHRIVHEILGDHNLTKFGEREDEKLVTIQPTLFSKHTRTFHWVGVADWQIDPNEIVSAIREAMTRKVPSTATGEERKATIEKEWNDFYNNLTGSRILGKIKDAVNYVDPYIKDATRQIGSDEHIAVLRHLLAIYEGYHHDPKLYLDGIVYRNLIKLHIVPGNSLANKIDYLYGKLVGEEIELKRNNDGELIITKVGHYKRYKWVQTSFHLEGPPPSSPLFDFQCQEVMGIDGLSPTNLNAKQAEELDYPGLPVALKLTDSIFFDRIKTTFKKEPTHVLLLPLYDVCVGEETWGSLCGNLVLFFGDQEHLNHFIGKSDSGNGGKTLLDTLRDKSQRIIQEYNKSGALLLLSQVIIAPYDLIQHFLRNLNIVQDWERITVYRGEKPQYSYHWWWNPEKVNEPEWKQYAWKRCDCGGAGASDTNSCEQCLPWEDTGDNKKFLRWEQNLDIWSGQFLSDISREEEQAFRDIRLVFEYPITACIPGDDTKSKMLGEEYIRQQLEVLRGLIPKVRARRSALRNAAVSVMSRNLSHNIGSHVLAAMRSGKLEDHAPHDKDEFNAAYQSFFSHLQARMDFIAELSTTRTTLHFPASLKDDIVGTAGKYAGIGFMGLDLLRKYISARRENGKPVVGKVSFQGDDIRVDIVGGMLGYQALFTIFENLIRNVAKHTATLSKDNSTITLKLRCDLDKTFPGYVKVTIWDEQGSACEEQSETPQGQGGQDVVADSKEEGEKKKLWQSLDDQFKKVRLLDESGGADPNQWGLKEIFICAAYLRDIALEDLEAPLPPNQRLVQVLAAGDDGIKVAEDATKGNLAYQIYLPTARELAVVFDEIPDKLQRKQEEAVKHGIGFFAVKEISRPIPHQLVAWLAEVTPGPTMRGLLSTMLSTKIAKQPLLDLLHKDLYSEAINHARDAFLDEELKRFGENGNSPPTVYSLNFSAAWLNVLSATDPVAISSFPSELTGVLEKPPSTLEQKDKQLLRGAILWDYHFASASIRKFFPSYYSFGSKGCFCDFLKDGAGYEVFPSISKQSVLLATWTRALETKTISPQTIQRECQRGFHSGVLILDERIQESVHKAGAEHPFLAQGLLSEDTRREIEKHFSQLACYFGFPAMLAASNVWVPAPGDIDLYDPSKKLDEFLKNLMLDEIKAPGGRTLRFAQIYYVVIHQGVIDRLRRDKKDAILKEFFMETTKEKTLVVCSGRGRPAELAWVYKQRPDVRFIPVSSLLDHVVSHPSKMHLVMSLDASRCPL